MSGIVVDTSEWIEFLAGRSASVLEHALAAGLVVVPPLVVAELVSGARTVADRGALADLLDDLMLHHTTFDHWVRVGSLRHSMRATGVIVSTPDAHVAQCALDRDVPLLTRDGIFLRIAERTELRLAGTA
ncbi:MAG TPA: PIN domain-containing protein [Vicinamibacterales bacterium]|nr:PIN domain-containing protein [Vicinamibacterales bacterium]